MIFGYIAAMHRAGLALGVAVFLGGLALVTCNPFPSYSGLTGGGGAGMPDGAVPDAGFCPPQAIFCDDFERDPADVQGSWTSENATMGNTLSIVGGQPTGQVLAAGIVASSSTMKSAAALQDNPISPSTQLPLAISNGVTLSSAIWVDPNLSTVVNTHQLTFSYVAPDGGYITSGVFAYFNGGPELVLAEVVIPSPQGFAMSSTSIHVTTGRWHQMTLSVDFTSSPATLTVTLDPDAADAGLGGTISYPSMLGVHAGTLSLQGGATVVNGPTGALQMMFDNIVVTGS